MHIALVSPSVAGVTTGNLRSAEDYLGVFRRLGHRVAVSRTWSGEPTPDVLVALHGAKSHAAITRFRAAHPDKPIVLVLTGTDIYPEPDSKTLESMAIADRMVSLQDRAPRKIPDDLRHKNRTILHGAAPSGNKTSNKSEDPFDIVVAGHLRDVKDPMRAAYAARLVPPSSKIRIRHAGAILDEKYRALVARELRENHRYESLGQLSPDDLKAVTARSQLMIVSSINEGGARIVGESIVDGTPVLSSRIDGVVGLLDEDYPGYFPVRGTEELAALMSKVESDRPFRARLQAAARLREDRFDPARQVAGWDALLNEIA